MAKDDNKLIWKALVEGANPDAEEWAGGGPLEDLEQGPDFKNEEEESPTSNLDKLIGLATAVSEDAEGVEDINLTDEKEAAEWVDEHTPL